MKLFNKYDTNIEVQDLGLRNYINLSPLIVVKTTGRYVKMRFWKSKYNIVERLMNKIMVPGHKSRKHKTTSGRCTGKAQKAYKIVLKTFQIIEEKTKKNPVEVFVRALENAAPREEITTIEYGGAKYPQAVECSPQRRIDLTLRQMIQGSYQRSFNNKKKFHEVLAEEIINAYGLNQQSQAISKKLELERQSDSSR
jgi:small subunit ribosomal protein S7